MSCLCLKLDISMRRNTRDYVANYAARKSEAFTTPACDDCCYLYRDYDLHFLCAMPFLEEINHPSHPHHPLILQRCAPDKQFKCCICDKEIINFDGLAAYTCVKCNLHMHASCVLRIPTVPCESNDHNQHLCHKRPMELIGIKDPSCYYPPKVVKCYICDLPMSRQAYACKICNNVFHINSCTELSPKIRHPLHLRHRLILKTRQGKDAACHYCHRTCLHFIYRHPYVRCKFYMCIGCTVSIPTVRPTIKYQGHNHLLRLDKKVHRDDDFECCASYTYCKQLGVSSNELTHTQDYIFCCEDCNFGVHLLCGPLPFTIKHKDHLHPLTLFDSMVEDDSGEYYCDACETERDPRICVYYCADCKYIAHFHCVISEVLRVLQGDCRDVELRVVGQTSSHLVLKMKEKEKVTQMTLLDMFTSVRRSLEEEEEEEEEAIWEVGEKIMKAEERENNRKVSNIMNSFLRSRTNYASDQRSKLNISKGLVQSQKQVEKNKGQEYFPSSFADENLEEFIHSFDYSTIRWSKVTSDELKLKIVNVGGYMTTWNLAHVLKDLLAKHRVSSGGDQNKSSSPEFYKISLLYFLLCRILHNMSRIMVVDLTEDLLGDWYSCLNFLKSNGFEVDFLNSHLHQIVRAYVGLQVSRAEIATRAELDKKIVNLREEIVNLKGKLKRCEEDLEICEERQRLERLRRGSSETSTDLVKECLNMASKFKWKNVADGLL